MIFAGSLSEMLHRVRSKDDADREVERLIEDWLRTRPQHDTPGLREFMRGFIRDMVLSAHAQFDLRAGDFFK